MTRTLPSWREELFQTITTVLAKRGFDVDWYYDPAGVTTDGHRGSRNLIAGSIRSRLRRCGRFEFLNTSRSYIAGYQIVVSEVSPKLINNWSLFLRKAFGSSIKWIGWSSGYFFSDSWIKRVFRRLFFSATDCLMVYSNHARQVFREELRYSGPIAVIGNSPGDKRIARAISRVRHERISELRRASGSRTRVLFVGKLLSQKRVDLLVRAAVHLSADHWFTVIGDGPEKENLQRLAIEHGANNIKFLGRIVDGVADYFQAADVFLMPGTGGMALLEACYHGLPVVTSMGDGIGYDVVTDGANGYIKPELSLEDIVESLSHMRRRNLYGEFSAKSRLIAEAFTTDAIAERFAETIECLI